MNTTAGIFSMRVRYCASRLGRGAGDSRLQGSRNPSARSIRICSASAGLSASLLIVLAMPPLRLAIQRRLGEAPQGMDRAAVSGDRIGGEQRPRRLIQKRHELIGKPRHGAADTDAADIG